LPHRYGDFVGREKIPSRYWFFPIEGSEKIARVDEDTMELVVYQGGPD